MSFLALAWATKLKVDRASDKLILLAFADRHNDETGFAYPSIAWLCEFSSLNRKTVIAAVERLEGAGHLSDTGKRTGATRQIKVYQVNVGTVPKTEQSQKRNSTEISAERSQKRDTEPVREPITSEANASSVSRAENDNRTVEKASPRGRASKFVPPTWQPSPAHVAKAAELRLDVEAQAELFRLHEFKDPKSDFDLAFHRWLRTAATDFNRGPTNGYHRPANDFSAAASHGRRSRAERDQQAALAVLADRRAAVR